MRKCPCLLHLWLGRTLYTLWYAGATFAAIWGLLHLP